MKLTNPKQTLGSDKVPFHLWPEVASILGALGCEDGMLKYGRTNWRAAGVRASIYYDAVRRHMNAWFEGEDIDPDSGLHHFAHALASIAILADAMAAGRFNDDRMVAGGYRAFIDAMTPEVARLKEKHSDKSPHHYTIADDVTGVDAGDPKEDVEAGGPTGGIPVSIGGFKGSDDEF
jgi:hypothetical protein